MPLPMTQNFNTLIISDKDKAIRAAEVPRPGPTHVIAYSDGSRIEKKNTAAAAWCVNTKHSSSHQLGKEVEYGIFEAKYVGLVIALRLIKYSITATTRQATIILENQGVVKDMSTKKTSFQVLTHKTEATKLIKDIDDMAPRVKLALRWCPGHAGIQGNEEADRLATTAAKKPLPKNHTDRPTFASFQAAIKDWAEKKSISSYTHQDARRLGHEPHPREHLRALTEMKNKHSVSSITQLRSGHIPLYHYLASRNLRTDSTCVCETSPETVEHFLFNCPLHNNQRQELRRELEDLEIPFNRTALHHPQAMVPIANYEPVR